MPKPHPEQSALYVVEFDQGTIKVGFASNPVDRIQSHIYQAKKFRIGVLRHWVSEMSSTAFLHEQALIAWCTQQAKETHGKEWFTGLSFEEAKDAAIFILANDGVAPAN
jgi:hypothetical protein